MSSIVSDWETGWAGGEHKINQNLGISIPYLVIMWPMISVMDPVVLARI